MNLLEAIKSGKRFYRKCWPSVGFEPITFERLDELSKEEVLANDWVIEEKEVTITASQFTAAWANAVKEAMISTSPDYERIIYQQLKKDLGL